MSKQNNYNNNLSILPFISLLISLSSWAAFIMKLNNIGMMYYFWICTSVLAVVFPFFSKFFRCKKKKSGRIVELIAFIIGDLAFFNILSNVAKTNEYLNLVIFVFIWILYEISFNYDIGPKTTKSSTRKESKAVSMTGILAAMSAILYVFPKIRWVPPFHFLEIDLADIPALIASCIINPVIGGVVILIRNSVHLLMTTTGMVGELSNFIISGMFVVCAGIMFNVLKKKQTSVSTLRLIAVMTLATVVRVVVAVLCNKYIMIPMYGIQGDPAEYIMMAVVPFNLIKTLMSSAIFVIIYKALIPKIKRYI